MGQFDDAILSADARYTGFRFKVYDDDSVLGLGGSDYLGETEIFSIADMTECDDIYSMQMPLFRGDVEEGTIFVEISFDSCCEEEENEVVEMEETKEEEETYEEEKPEEVEYVEEKGKDKGSKPK